MVHVLLLPHIKMSVCISYSNNMYLYSKVECFWHNVSFFSFKTRRIVRQTDQAFLICTYMILYAWTQMIDYMVYPETICSFNTCVSKNRSHQAEFHVCHMFRGVHCVIVCVCHRGTMETSKELDTSKFFREVSIDNTCEWHPTTTCSDLTPQVRVV